MKGLILLSLTIMSFAIPYNVRAEEASVASCDCIEADRISIYTAQDINDIKLLICVSIFFVFTIGLLCFIAYKRRKKS